MSDLTTEMLRMLEPQDVAALLPAPVQICDRAGVILRQLSPGSVELYHAAQITPVDVSSLDFEPVTDPAAQAAAMAEAVEALTICRQVSFEAHAEQRQAHAETLADIRVYAINAMEQGVIYQQGLDAFLAEFNLEPYGDRVTVTYTMTGTYEVEGSSAYEAVRDAEAHLQPDLSGLGGLSDAGTEFQLNVHTTED